MSSEKRLPCREFFSCYRAGDESLAGAGRMLDLPQHYLTLTRLSPVS
jgi:hypothetical protein